MMSNTRSAFTQLDTLPSYLLLLLSNAPITVCSRVTMQVQGVGFFLSSVTMNTLNCEHASLSFLYNYVVFLVLNFHCYIYSYDRVVVHYCLCIITGTIIESVDSISRDGPDTP